MNYGTPTGCISACRTTKKNFVTGYLDDYSRHIVYMDLIHHNTVKNTVDLLKTACNDYTPPKGILTDGGRQFVSWTGEEPVRDLSAQPQDQADGLPPLIRRPMEKWHDSDERCGRKKRCPCLCSHSSERILKHTQQPLRRLFRFPAGDPALRNVRELTPGEARNCI